MAVLAGRELPVRDPPGNMARNFAAVECVMELRRRDFLKWAAAINAVGSVPLLPGCARDEPLPEGAPFSLWRRIREAVRASPDHLAERARSVVSSGDPGAIFAFVRDEIRLRPWPNRVAAVAIRNAGHAGTRGVLRSGIATAREKAELLKDLLAGAGYEAEIVDGNIDFEALGGTDLFANGEPAAFAPDASLAPIERWLGRLGIEAGGGVQAAELDPARLDALAGRLLAAIPEAARGTPTDWAEASTWLPLVRLQRDGQAVFANPNVPGAALGEHYCTSAPRPSPNQETVPTPALRMTLAMTRQVAPRELETILEGEWPVGDLIGRRVQLRFLPTQAVDQLLPMPIGQLRSFQPAFIVAGADVESEEAGHLGFSGDIVTVEGERISANGDEILIDGQSLRLGEADPTLAATIDQVDLAVNASEYPRVRIEAGFRNSDGEQVNGLPLSVFALHHGERPVAARLTRNMPAAPRIAFALDFSTSLPEQYQFAGLATIVERMTSAVAERMPDAEFRAGYFSGGPLGNAITYLSDWASGASATPAAIRANSPQVAQPSSYFAGLADATNSDANLVVLITDADGSASESPEFTALISRGCPAVIIDVPSAMSRTEHFERMAELSGGHRFPIDSLDAAVDTVVALTVAHTERPYTFEFSADGFTSDENRVRLAVIASGAFMESAYEPPVRPVSSARALSGLYLTVECGNRRVTRRLAGFPLVSESLLPLTAVELDAARLGLLGRYDLSVEAAAPTAAAALDDVLAAQLSAEPLVTSAVTRDEATILAATQQGFERLPAGWLALNSPLPDGPDAGAGFEAGYRIVLFSDLPVPEGHYRRKADILPFSDWRTIADQGANPFVENLRTTLKLSMLESENFANSTVDVVGDAGYTLQPTAQFSNWAMALDDTDDQISWRLAAADRGQPRLRHQLLLPEDPSRRAYWEVDLATGAVLGLLPDASGGATVEDTNRRFELLAQVIDAYTEIMQALIATPPAFQAWVELEKAKLEHLKRATIALILMDGTYTSGYGDLLADQVQGWISDRIRGAIDAGLGERITGYSELQEAIGWHSRVQALWGAATNSA